MRLHEVDGMLGTFAHIALRAEQLEVGRLMLAAGRQRLNMINMILLVDADSTAGAFAALHLE